LAMDVRSLAVGLVAAVLAGLVAQYVSLGPVATAAIGAAIGALLPHREDSQTALGGFLLAAILALLPTPAAETLGAAMLGYTVARHT